MPSLLKVATLTVCLVSLAASARPEDLRQGGISRDMYDRQAESWVRTEPRCLSDFTGRPVVFSFLESHLLGSTVLDVGCGEGYCARRVGEMGASRVIGSDVSEGMIRRAIEAAGEDGRYKFFAAPCGNLLREMEIRAESLRIRGGWGRGGAEGCADVAMAVFLFNYLTSSEMGVAMRQIHTALRPGGIFVFSVPHPSMIYGSDDESSVFTLEANGEGYFSSRDEKILGRICTIDGERLKIMSVHKTLNDYIAAINAVGFEILDIREAGVTEEHMKMNPAFFKSVEDRPLHLVFKLRKKQ